MRKFYTSISAGRFLFTSSSIVVQSVDHLQPCVDLTILHHSRADCFSVICPSLTLFSLVLHTVCCMDYDNGIRSVQIDVVRYTLMENVLLCLEGSTSANS